MPVLPIADIAQHLEERSPIPHFRDEQALFITLPDSLRSEIETLLEAFALVKTLAKAMSVQAACVRSICLFKYRWPLKTFREKYDKYQNSGDWVCLVNRSKAGAAWQDTVCGLPDPFLLQVCQPYFARFKRHDGKRQAILAIYRWWRTGRSIDGELKPVPGYEAGWKQRLSEVLPLGWSETNIRRQMKARDASLTPPVQKLLQESIAAAKEHLPQVLGTRVGLRFLERVTFDDVRTDFIVFDPATGEQCELWLLVARDEATAMVLGFVMHLSRARENGTDSHLGQKEMRQLAAWLLERYPLPPYLCTWRIERGTATLSAGSASAIQEFLPDSIRISYTGMIGGASPVGYREKAKGNSRGKASHESHNRLFHTQGSYLQGQTGSHYSIRPADLNARAKECVETWELRQRLPEHERGNEKYTLLTPPEAREHLIRICIEQNFRDDHALEGFSKVLEWLDPASGQWRARSSHPCSSASICSCKFRTRMERPVERAAALIASVTGWRRVSPDIIVAFLSHLARKVAIKPSGEIELSIEDRKVRFAPPPNSAIPALCKSALAYFSPNDPAFLHVTDGRGSILGTWFRRDRVAHADHEALAQAIRYTTNALNAAKATAADLAAPERQQLEAIRAHNAELERGNEFIEIAPAPAIGHQQQTPSTISSPVAAALTTTAAKTRAQIKAAQKAAAELDDQSLNAFRKAASKF